MSNKYTEPGFNPSNLRVIDLKRILTENGIIWASKHRKSDLIKLFNDKLIPKLQLENEKNQEKANKHIEQKLDKTIAQTSNHNNNNNNNNNDIIWKSMIKNPVVDKKKRKFNDISISNDDTTYEDQLRKRVKRIKSSKIKNKKIVPESNDKMRIRKKDNDQLFDRNSSIKFEENSNHENQIIEKENSILNTSMKLIKLEDKENDNLNNEIPIANSTFADTKLIDDKNSFYQNNTISTLKDQTNTTNYNYNEHDTEPILSTPVKVKLENDNNKLLSGPTKDIRTKEGTMFKKNIEDDIKVKIEQLNQLRNEINEDLKLMQLANNDIHDNSTDDIQILDMLPTNNSTLSLKNVTFDDDSELLTQLQHEFEIENSKIEIESEKVLNLINSKERFKYYKIQFIKIIIGWILILLISFIFVIYRQERINVGFCGLEIRKKSLFSLLNINLPCVKCPDHSICYPNSQISCFSPYKLSKPFFWSLNGILPTFNKCILDSRKISKINKIVKNVINLLHERNANFKCGEGSDDEVSLNFNQIKEIIDQKLLLDPNDPQYDYYWDKVKLILTTRTDLKFINRDENNEIIRSISFANLSIKCRLKKLIINILLKYKFYLISILTIIMGLSYLFYQINQIQKRNECYRAILMEIINKLKKQSVEYKQSPTNRKSYIAKIQLRDYYIPQLQKLSKHNREIVWKSIVNKIEANSNIKTEDVEVNGDIMRVWSWSSDV